MTESLLTRVRAVATTILIVTSHGFGLSAAAEAQATETEIKAAFLYNFTKFIEWPPALEPAEPFRLCILNDDRLKKAVDQTITGESANGRELRSVAPSTPEEATACQVLFVGRIDSQRAGKFLNAVAGLPVLLVTDASAGESGDVEFVLEDHRLRFDVNLAAAERRGLKISSKLLRVARKVNEVPR